MEQRIGEPAIVFRDRHLVVSRMYEPDGLRLVGQVDISNVEGLQKALDTTLQDDGQRSVVHLDLTLLEFSDVSGIQAIVTTAENSDGQYCLVLHGLPPLLSRVLGVVGWSDLPALVVDDSFPPAESSKPEHEREGTA